MAITNKAPTQVTVQRPSDAKMTGAKKASAGSIKRTKKTGGTGVTPPKPAQRVRTRRSLWR